MAYVSYNPNVFKDKTILLPCDDPNKASEQVQKLYADSYVKNCKGIFEYILGGSTDSKLLDIRVFDDEINFVKSYH